MILVAVAEPLLGRILGAGLLGRLSNESEVVISPTPADFLSPACAPLLATAEVIITGWGSGRVDADVLARAPRLRGVVHTAGSVKAYADPCCFDHEVQISSQAWANAVPVAEYSLAMILLCAKGVFRAQREYRSARRRAEPRPGTERSGFDERGGYGLQVGLIGASMVGRRVLDLLAAHDLRVVLADPTLSAADAQALGAELVGLDGLMAGSAVVSLHAPWLPSTEGMIGRDQLARLPDGATFINTARGALVDQDALIDELRSGRIDAVLDVTWPEVPVADSPLWELPNVVLTPHLAGSSGNELRRMGASAVRETIRLLRGEPLHHGVERDRYHALA